MKRILITGGPVHAYLDAVKIITNRFNGGLMARLADDFVNSYGDDVKVAYLTTTNSKTPTSGENVAVVYHDGFEDYREQVKELSLHADAVILGAAVANLIPLNPLTGKFPSHNFKVGDRIPIDFTIAPRIINEVKTVNPKVHLFGFKLLSGVSHDELIRAAYEVVLDSKATAVIANDTSDLLKKYIVTKERGVHPIGMSVLAEYLWQMINDEYYHTEIQNDDYIKLELAQQFQDIKKRFQDKFVPTPEGYVFGTIAVRAPSVGFLTTGRGKRELDDFCYVNSVDHETLTVKSTGKKATLNAPLLDYLFMRNPTVQTIVHYHEQNPRLRLTLPYAPPGTRRDSLRYQTTSFNIEEHGCFLLLDKNLNIL